MDATPPPAYSHAQIKRVVTGIMLCILLAALDQTVVIPAVPAIASELNAIVWIVRNWFVRNWFVRNWVFGPDTGAPDLRER